VIAGPWLYVILGVVVAGGLAGSYVKGRSDGRALEVAERATLEEVARESREAAMEAAAEQIAKISKVHTTIRQQAETVIREVPVYRDCVNDAAVIRMLDAARENRAPGEPAGDSELPGVGASPAPNVR
jgi:hypothetical protein